MSQEKETFDPFDPTGMFKEMRDSSMSAWAKMMVEVVNTEAYAESTGAMMDAWLKGSEPYRKVTEEALSRSLANLNLPSREDVTRLAERLTNIEMRLDDLDAKLDANARPAAQRVKKNAKPNGQERK